MKRRDFITLLSGAAAWPLVARAQQMRSPYRIGFLGLLPSENTSTFMKSFLERLNELYRVPLIRTGAPIGAIRWT